MTAKSHDGKICSSAQEVHQQNMRCATTVQPGGHFMNAFGVFTLACTVKQHHLPSEGKGSACLLRSVWSLAQSGEC